MLLTAAAPACLPAHRDPTEECVNGIDDDGDGLVDQADPDCFRCGDGVVQGAETCDDGEGKQLYVGLGVWGGGGLLQTVRRLVGTYVVSGQVVCLVGRRVQLPCKSTGLFVCMYACNAWATAPSQPLPAPSHLHRRAQATTSPLTAAARAAGWSCPRHRPPHRRARCTRRRRPPRQ